MSLEHPFASLTNASLTKPQRKILDAIHFFLRKGEVPTVREVGALVGLRSPATVLKHLRALEKAKLVSLSGKSRGIRLTLSAHSYPHSQTRPKTGIRLVGAIAAGQPFESYPDAYAPETTPGLPFDPGVFVQSGDVFALRVKGDSMINAGILDGDYAIIRRQNTVEEGEIAAVIINGEGTLKRWHSQSDTSDSGYSLKAVSLQPANESFDPIDIKEEDAKDVLIFGKYVGLVRGNLLNP